MQRWTWIVSVVGSVLTALLFWFTSIPLGIPGEWTWPRITDDPQAGLSLLLAGLFAGGYLLFVQIGAQRLQTSLASRAEAGLWLLCLPLAGGTWIWMVQDTGAPAAQFAKLPFVLYYPSSSGYFHHVKYVAPDAGELLNGYEKLMAEEDHLHIGTHPPGLFLVFHAIQEFQFRFPRLAKEIYRWAPYSFRDAWDVVAENTSKTSQPATSDDAITIWLAGLLAFACAATTVWPLYGLLRLSLSKPDAWIVASFWPTVPAVSIFLPKSDAAYPLIASVSVFCFLRSWQSRSLIVALLAGFVLWAGLMTSLAFLPVVAVIGLWLMLDAVRWNWQDSLLRRIQLHWLLCFIGMSVLGFVLPLLWLQYRFSLNMLRIWGWNYRNHAGFYEDFTRTWWKWFLINPWELMFAVGAPLATLAIASLWNSSWRRRSWTFTHCGVAAGCLIWAILWVSGKNSGEAARLWVLFMPAIVWLAGQRTILAPSPSHDSRLLTEPVIPHWRTFLALQLAVCVLTVHRVGGFHLHSP